MNIMRILLCLSILFLCSRTLGNGEKENLKRDPVLQRLESNLRAVLKDLKPKPTFEYPSSSTNSLVVKYKPRVYTIHPSDKAGRRSQETVNAVGPSFDGFIIRAYLQKDGVVNQPMVPQVIKEPYWQTYVNVYRMKRRQKQIYLCLSYCGWTDKNIIAKIKETVDVKVELAIESDRTVFRLGEEVTFGIRIKNMTDEALDAATLYWSSRVILDGKEYKLGDKYLGVWNGPSDILPGTEMFTGITLSRFGITKDLLTLGRHDVAVRIGNAVSNTLTITITNDR